MKIINLKAENFKRIKAVEITPDLTGSLVEITGKNGQGKTSVLDSILAALGGVRNHPPEPIRTGEENAEIVIQFGELQGNPDMIVKRSFARKKDGSDVTTKIVVETQDGARYSSPQQILDKFVGSLAFDPLAFARSKPDAQFQQLRQFVPELDFDQLAKDRKELYDLRTHENRMAKQKRAELDSIGPVEDAEEVSVGDLIAERDQMQAHNRQVVENTRERESLEAMLEREKSDIETRRADAAAEIERITQNLKAAEEAHAIAVRGIEQDLEETPRDEEIADTSKVDEAIAGAEETNRKAAVCRRVRRLDTAAKEHEERSKEYTDKIDAQDRMIADTIAKADMPVDGIELADGRVRFGGVPLEQASDAEKLRISCSIAMAANPKLRVIRIRDGSLLDADSMGILREMASERDYQVWIERVDDSGAVGIVIEDGRIKE